MTKTFSMTGKEWMDTIKESADDPAAAGIIAEIQAALDAYRAEVAAPYAKLGGNWDETIDRQVANKTHTITITIPA